MDIKFNKSEFVRYKDEEYILLDIVTGSDGVDIYQIWNLIDGNSLNVSKDELEKHEIETIDFASFHEEELNQAEEEMSFNIGLTIKDELGEDMVQNADTSGRHKKLDQDGLDEISRANTEVATDYQTKWAVKIFTGIFLATQNSIVSLDD